METDCDTVTLSWSCDEAPSVLSHSPGCAIVRQIPILDVTYTEQQCLQKTGMFIAMLQVSLTCLILGQKTGLFIAMLQVSLTCLILGQKTGMFIAMLQVSLTCLILGQKTGMFTGFVPVLENLESHGI